MRQAIFFLSALLLIAGFSRAADDPYLRYIREAPEFQSVPQEAKLLSSRWNTWIYMPWRYQWSIGTEEAGGQFCADHGIKFIGPTPEMITKMGDKMTAKETMIAAGVPIIPGSQGLLESLEEAKSLARDMGYPVILKATAGGGGKGMRVV